METEAKQIGACLPTIATASPVRSTDALRLDTLPGRLDDTLLARVDAIAKSSPPALRPCSETYLAQQLRTMLAVLPRKASDELSGELFVAVYERYFHRWPKAQVEHVVACAIENCRWFPTINECLEMAASWERRDDHTARRAHAEHLVEHERRLRYEDFMERLRTGQVAQEKIDRLPDHIVWEARKRGALVRDREAQKWVAP